MIAGETNQSFTPSGNGSYAVEITLNGCVDTSACEMITTVGLNSVDGNTGVRCYPNPANDQIGVDCAANSLISIINQLGQTVKEVKAADRSVKINISDLAAGVYFVKVKSESGTVITRVVKE